MTKQWKYEIIERNGEEEYGVKFSMGNQYFTLNYWVEEKEEAQWMIDTLKKAHEKAESKAREEVIEDLGDIFMCRKCRDKNGMIFEKYELF